MVADLKVHTRAQVFFGELGLYLHGSLHNRVDHNCNFSELNPLQGYPPYEWGLLVHLLVDVYLLVAPIGFIRATYLFFRVHLSHCAFVEMQFIMD